MRGTIYRSVDNGQSWTRMQTGVSSSITDLVTTTDGIAAVGLEGVALQNTKGGSFAPFTQATQADWADLTAAVLAKDGKLVMFSGQGPVSPR
ncbi:hypothetical protein DN412_29665 [Cupriavidus lacunae]|uniref:Glycosyl hydrolase n=2 Tax=Cupriavidus lacunae TaxID=2666307 RepID=A0A370NMC4_9BURK|nr:hypothetical protein DN412_29665 [Cupriavidus lacunae]